jgi:hypothetical protein
MPLVLQVYIWDHKGSLDTPNMDTQFEIMNYHLDFLIGSTFWICSSIGYISITLPLYQETNDSNQAEGKYDVNHLSICIGCTISIVNDLFLIGWKPYS